MTLRYKLEVTYQQYKTEKNCKKFFGCDNKTNGKKNRVSNLQPSNFCNFFVLCR